MTEALTRAERIARAQTADRLKEEIGGHIVRLEASYKTAWAKAETPEAREHLWLKLRALTDLTRDIVTIIEDGRVAEAEEEYDRHTA